MALYSLEYKYLQQQQQHVQQCNENIPENLSMVVIYLSAISG